MNVSHFNNMDSDSESDAGVDDFNQILYDIVTYKEWEQDPEVLKNGDRHIPRLSNRWLGPPSTPVLPPTLERLGSALLPWHLAVSADASLIAVLGDTVLEVWSSRDNYSQLVGRRGVERDMSPQWRHLVWTTDCSLLVVAHSSGAVEVCDTVGNQVYNLISPRIAATQPGWADSLRSGPVSASYAGVFFTEARVRDKTWVTELVLVDFSGLINSFYVSLTGYQELSSYSLGWSVTAATFCSSHNLLLTGGGPDHPLAGKSRLVGRASHAGIVALRLLNDSPHYVELLDAEEQSLLSSRPWLPALPFVASAPSQDYIIKLSVSNCGQRLAVLHQSGTLSVWLLPSLVLESSTKLEEQPLHDECNPQLLQAPERRKAKAEFLANPLRYHPVGVSWWNSESVVLARISGALTVLGVQDLSNMLGDSPEFLEGVPRISQCFQKGFFGLECDLVVRGRRPSCREESAGEDPDVELEVESDEDDDTWFSVGKRSATAVAYYLTDIERFAPPKKKAKIVRRTYRLLALVSTSPEELYNRKILLEEYGEAILLAQHYGLDTDSVYSRQWQQSTKSLVAIQDYLAKMKRRGEVLKECLETIPEDIDAARALIEYGLRATDLEAMIALAGDNADTGELVLADTERVMAEVDTIEEKELLEKKERIKLIAKVRWESLTLVQKDLISTRLKLLYYLDCLHTLEDILGGGVRASERFSPSQYKTLRSHNPLENCLRAARQGDTSTVLALLGGRHASHIVEHWLPVVAMFPETVHSSEYKELLPCVGEEGVEELFRHSLRESDWCEGALAVKWGGARPVWDSSILYSDQTMVQYRTEHLTPSLVSSWYCTRAREVVQRTSLPDMGLELLNLGLERGATIHWELLHNLRTLDCLVYEVQEEVDLDSLEKMDSIQQMELLLSRHATVLGVRKFLQPFLQRLEDNKPGEMKKLVHQLCVARAVTDLTFPLVVVEHSGPDKTGPVLYSVVDTIRLALDCCYANTTGAQVETAEKIYLSILSYFKENPGTRQLKYNISHMRLEVEMFKQHLEISRTLSNNGVVKPLAHIRDNIDKPAVMRKLFDAVTARAEGARPPLDQDGWRTVLRDLQLLQSLIQCVAMETVIYSYTESLLSSGSSSNIDLAGTVLEGVVETGDTLQLVVTAWRHYYTSSSGVGDPDLELAKKCLALAPPGCREVQDCYDLITALQSLVDFGLGDVLPVAVLECKDRMEFVRQAVSVRPTAYKNSQRLMKLASLLRVNGGEPVEGMVWATIARRALDVGDYSTSQTACNNFILAGYTAGWDICYALAARGDFTDLDKCSELLAFAVSHCDKENIANIMQTIVTVEQKNLTSKLSSKIDTGRDLFENGFGDEEEEDEIFDDAIEEAEFRNSREISPLNTVLNITSLTSQFLLQHQVTAGVWQQTSSWLSKVSTSNMERSFCEDQVIDVDFTSVRTPQFYISLFPPDTPLSALDLSYTKYSRPMLSQDLGVASYQILRISCLSQTILALSKDSEQSNTNCPCISPDLLDQLLPLLASQDILLGLCLLLSAPSTTSVPALQNLPRTLPSLCLALTYISILLLVDQPGIEPRVFSCSPEHLVQTALESKTNLPLYNELISYLELATDFHQGNQLSGLAGQVDVERFTSDYQYKEDTILGLAMFTEPNKWELTLTLAKRYSLPLWVVYATHLETILTSTLSCSEARLLVSERQLVSNLQSDPERLEQWMSSKVLPLLDGLDAERLILCYSVLEEVGSSENHQRHVEALYLIMEEGLHVDYRLLEQGSEEVLELLADDNVDTIAQLVTLLDNPKLSASKVFHCWAFKAFLQHGGSKDNWIEAFSVCQKFMEKMEPEDVQSFVRNCILSARSINTVPRPARGRIFKKAVKFVEVKIAGKAEGDWQAVETWLQKIKIHSDKLKKPLSIEVISKLEDKYSGCFDDFEMTGGDDVEIMKLIAGFILQGFNTNVIKSLVQVWKQDLNSCSEGLLEILQADIDQILHVGKEITEEPFKLLESLLKSFDLPSMELSELISPLCTNDAVPINHRLTLVKLLKELAVEVGPNADLDSSMLAVLYETQHDIERILPDFIIEKSDLENNGAKWQLFEKIVNQCTTSKQLLDFHGLMQKWEGFEDETASSSDNNCLQTIAYRMLNIDSQGKDLLELLDNVNEQKLPPGACQALLSHCEDLGQTMLVVKLALQLKITEKYESVLEILCDQTSCDRECLRLLVSRGMVCSIVGTVLYHQLVQMVLEEEESLELQVVEQLTQGGHKPQAQTLQMLLEGVPDGLRTMTSVVQRLSSVLWK